MELKWTAKTFRSSGAVATENPIPRDALVWDNHGCMPLRPQDARFLPQLQRYRDAGVHIVSLNVGFDAMPWENTPLMLAHFRRWILQHPDEYALDGNVDDILAVRANGKLGVCFDIEGGCALAGQLSKVSSYYHLGVRWMLIAYNRNNELGAGCMGEDTGLTAFGREVVVEMNRVGMVVCCSHSGFRTTMEVMELSSKPVIFSHSNPLGVWQHKRNITDEAIKACAATGGVVGINGIGDFLGINDASTATIVRHIDYTVELVGVEHVGLALDYVFDQQELLDYLAAHPEVFPPGEVHGSGIAMVRPEQLPEIAGALGDLGYSADDLRAILGGNHLRIANQCWK